MSLGSVLGQFGQFLQKHATVKAEGTPPAPDALEHLSRVRAALNHHIIPLLLLARSDGETAFVERAAIFQYCKRSLAASETAMSSAEEAALKDYLKDFHPSLMQLSAALKRLECDSKEHMAALIAGAKEVVEADLERRPEEAKVLAQIARTLERM